MDSSTMDECTVSGILGYVFLVGKIYGVASLSFQSAHNGWRIRVSRASCIHGRVTILTIGVAMWFLAVLDAYENDRQFFVTPISSSTSVEVATPNAVAAVLLVQSFCAIYRMQCTVTCLSQLQKIHEILSKYSTRTSFAKVERLAVWAQIGGHVNMIAKFATYVYALMNTYTVNVLTLASYMALLYIMILMLKILLLQITLVLIEILSSFNHLNDCLDKLVEQISKESVNSTSKLKNQLESDTKISSKSLNTIIDTLAVNGDRISTPSNNASEAVHRLAYLYSCLYEIVQIMDDSHGNILVTLMLHCFLSLVISPYYLITAPFGYGRQYYILAIELFLGIYHVLDVFMVVEPCHRTYKQMQRTQRLISHLFRVSSSEDYALRSELRRFYKDVMTNKVLYNPMKIITLDRTFIISIIGSIVTYLVIIIQL